jgi:ABC-type Fe3+ transport system substrate-binding protein
VTFEAWNTNDLYRKAAEDCRAGATEVDLLLSSAADQLVKLVNDGCAQPHRSVATAALLPERNWRDEVFGITDEPAVIVYNRDLVPPGEVPRTRFDLIDLLRPADSRYAGRVATYDIERSGVGYLFAFTDSQQATTFGSLIEAFARSGAVATCCSAEIIEGVADGRYLIAYNVLGSYALNRVEEDPRLAVVAPEDYTLVLSRAAMIPIGAPNPSAAGLLVDFLLSEAGRAALAAQHLLVREKAVVLPDDQGSLYRPIPLSPVLLLGLDKQKRAAFLDRWRATFAQ